MSKIIVKYTGSNPEFAEVRRLIARSQTALPNLAASDKQAIRTLSKIPHVWACIEAPPPSAVIDPKPQGRGSVALEQIERACKLHIRAIT